MPVVGEIMNDKIVEQLKDMSDADLFATLQSALDNRVVDWGESTDEYGAPTQSAKLAVIRAILCP